MTAEAAQGGAAAAAAEPAPADDGFTPEERTAFADMQKADATPPPADAPAEEAKPEPKPGESPPADGDKAKPGAAAETDEEDEGEEAAAAPKLGADGKPEEKQPPRRVNYNKFARMEERAKAAEKDRDIVKENFARVDERMKLLNEALMSPKEQKKAEEEDPEPDPEKDVFGWINWSRRKTATLEQKLNGMQEGQQTSAAETQIANTYVDDARSFQQTEPNFVPAYQWLMANRTLELAQYFYGKDLTEEGATLSPQEGARIKQAIAAEERDLVAEAVQNRQSPAKRIYGLARARGFRPAAAAAAAANGAAKDAAAANGKAAPGSLAEAPKVADEIGRIRKGSEAALSLSQGGGSPGSPLTPERLANMNDEEFGVMLDEMTSAQRKNLLGA